MYIGRFVVLGRTLSGKRFLGYRVSSRSFPNRRIVLQSERAVVLPTADAPPSDNPYIAYNCLRAANNTALVANGNHIDPMIEKVNAGYPLRDAMAFALLALDYEHDAYRTPRIAAGWQGMEGYIGIVAHDRIMVRQIELPPGEAWLIATYEINDPSPWACTAETPATLAQALFEAAYEHPIAALAAILDPNLSMAVYPPNG